MIDWCKELGLAVTVMDNEGKILEMNDRAAATFAKWGGAQLVNQNLFGCHNEKSQDKIRQLLASRSSNTYTIEKAGVRKLIHQTPWYENGEIAGLVEFSIELPQEMAHFKRD